MGATRAHHEVNGTLMSKSGFAGLGKADFSGFRGGGCGEFSEGLTLVCGGTQQESVATWYYVILISIIVPKACVRPRSTVADFRNVVVRAAFILAQNFISVAFGATLTGTPKSSLLDPKHPEFGV